MTTKVIQRHFLSSYSPIRDGSQADYAYGALSVMDVLPFLQQAIDMDVSSASLDTEAYVVIFGNAGVRWMVPASSHRCRQILTSWRPYGLASRVKWQIVEMMSYVSLLRYLPDTECFKLSISQLSDKLRTLGLPENLTPVIQVGNPSRTRKLTLFLLDGYSIHAVIKVPLTLEAIGAVADEANTLCAMSELRPAIPESLYHDAESGWSVQNWLNGTPSSRKFTSMHREFLLRMVRPDIATCLKTALRDNIVVQSGKETQSADKAKLEMAIEQLADTSLLPEVSVHGDFTPWNIKVDNGKLRIVDWESAQAHGLPLQDICHFFYRQDFLFREEQQFPELLFRHQEVKQYLAEFSLSRVLALRLILYYLVDLYYRHASCREDIACEYVMRQIDTVLARLLR